MGMRFVRFWTLVLALFVPVLAGGCSASDGYDEVTSEVAAPLTATYKEHRYYLLMFGSEDASNTAAGSHSFATFAHVGVPTVGPVEQTQLFEVLTISWLPRAFYGEVCVDLLHFRCPAEWGNNYSLGETLAFTRNRFVAMWGPLQIRQELYDRMLRQVQFLDSGRVFYSANDIGPRYHDRALRHEWGGAINCIHAMTDALYFVRTGLNWGWSNSRIALRTMEPWIIDRGTPAEWIVPRLALENVRLTRLRL